MAGNGTVNGRVAGLYRGVQPGSGGVVAGNGTASGPPPVVTGATSLLRQLGGRVADLYLSSLALAA